MISYAQNFEDVMLARLFGVEHHGFYIDIGAAHPECLSVTCHFYKHGWRGINVEPSQHFYPLLCAARPEDVNLQCAVGREAGRATFYEFLNCAENSTLDRPVADRLVAGGMPAAQHEVEVIPLADLCDMHVKARTIDFMKIDVEGGELAVLEGGNWEKFRPRVLIVEATVVNSREENWQTWEPMLVEAAYHKVWFDGLNNFYLREEDLQLRDAFRLPPNVFDNIERDAVHRSMEQQITDLNAICAERLALIQLLDKEVQGLRVVCEERLALINRLAARPADRTE